MNIHTKLLVFALTLFGWVFVFSAKTQAATLNISGGCTLDVAVASVNAGANQPGCTATGDIYGTNDEITIPAGTHTLTANIPPITEDLTVSGVSMAGSIVDGDAATYSAFKADGAGVTVEFSNFTIQNASTAGLNADNGAIVIIHRVHSLNNNEANIGGGLIVSAGSEVTVTNSIIEGNTSATAGGGFANAGGTLTISNSAILNNEGTNAGGAGLFVGGITTLTNVTIVGNTSDSVGGLISTNDAVASLVNVTIYGNVARGAGVGGININSATGGGSLTLTNTLIAGNTANSVEQNCLSDDSMIPTSNGGNLSSDTSCTFLNHATDLEDLDPLVATVSAQDNGGDTPTIALLAGSPALNAGISNGAPATDQRGLARPQGAGIDIGAYESEVLSATTDTPSVTTPGVPNTGIRPQSTVEKLEPLFILLAVVGIVVASRYIISRSQTTSDIIS